MSCLHKILNLTSLLTIEIPSVATQEYTPPLSSDSVPTVRVRPSSDTVEFIGSSGEPSKTHERLTSSSDVALQCREAVEPLRTDTVSSCTVMNGGSKNK